MDESLPGYAQWKWQDQRRRPDFRAGSTPVQGFGAAGDYTLWLPPAIAGRRVVFRNGRPAVESIDSCLGSPELRAIRDDVLASFVSAGPGLLQVDVQFLAYAAAVLALNYKLSDEDLGLVLEGDGWHDAMVRHLLGGPGAVDLVMREGDRFLQMLREGSDQDFAGPFIEPTTIKTLGYGPGPAAVIEPPSPKRSGWLARITAAVGRRIKSQ